MLAALEAGLGKTMGDAAGDALSRDIRESLNAFAREREERQRQVAVERQWQLSRTMAAQQRAVPAESAPEDKAGEDTGVPLLADADGGVPDRRGAVLREQSPAADGTPTPAAVAAAEERSVPEGRTSSSADAGERSAQSASPPPALQPLTEAEATSGLFARRPKINELFSVIKLTWKLMRRSR